MTPPSTASVSKAECYVGSAMQEPEIQYGSFILQTQPGHQPFGNRKKLTASLSLTGNMSQTDQYGAVL